MVLIDINLSGNTFTNGYFAGLFTGPYANGGWIITATNYTAYFGDKIQADTSAGTFTVTLPAAPDVGQEFIVEDATLSWDLNNLTISGKESPSAISKD